MNEFFTWSFDAVVRWQGAGEIQAPDHADTEVVLSDPLNACGPVCDGPSCPGAELPDATGKIMLLQRGTCYFTDKVLAAQNAGPRRFQRDLACRGIMPV